MAAASVAMLYSVSSLPGREYFEPISKNSWTSPLPFSRSLPLRGARVTKYQKLALEPRSVAVKGLGSSWTRPVSRKFPVAAAYDQPVSDEVHADGNITEGDKNPGNVQDSAQKWNGERRESSTSDADLFKSLRNSTEELQKQVEKAKDSLTEVAKKAVEKEKGGLSWGTENPPVQEQSRKGAKIHDFCFGIPYGGLLVGGGLLEFIITRNTTASLFGLLLGGAVLGLSITSLRVWKQGKSSVPYILGQAVWYQSLEFLRSGFKCVFYFRIGDDLRHTKAIQRDSHIYSFGKATSNIFSDQKHLSNRLSCHHQCCNAWLLFLHVYIGRKSTFKEVESSFSKPGVLVIM